MNRKYFIETVTKISAIIVIFSFFSGWVFTKSYFHNFGVNIYLLNLPLEHYFISSFFIIINIKTLLLILVSVIYFMLTCNEGNRKDILIVFDLLIFIFMFSFIFFLSVLDGKKIANKNKLSDTTVLPSVTFEFRNKIDIPDNLRLLYMGKDRLFLIKTTDSHSDELNIFVIKSDNIEYLKIIK